jgi:hypothetical protein
MRRLAAFLALVLLAAVVAVHAADAAPPVHNETITIPFEVTSNCQGFKVTETGAFTVTVTEYFDKEGNFVRAIVQESYEGVFTLTKSDATFTERGHHTLEFDADGTFSVSGQAFTIVGDEFKLYDVGRIIFDENGEVIFSSAQHPLLGGGFAALDPAICEALGATAGLT